MSFTPDIARAANGMALGDNRRNGPEFADLAGTGGPVAVQRLCDPHAGNRFVATGAASQAGMAIGQTRGRPWS